MENKTMENNIVRLVGKIAGKPEITHEIEGEKFWELLLDVKRLSGAVDTLPVTIPEKLLETSRINLKEGERIAIQGEFRSYNRILDGKSKLILSTFAKDMQIVDESFEDENYIFLTGFLCKEPIYRITPFNREICDAILAVNRKNFKSDYLPLISWGRNARYLQNQEVGTKILAEGRIQSRVYIKVIDGISEEKTAYEVSIQKLANMEKIKVEDEEVRERIG